MMKLKSKLLILIGLFTLSTQLMADSWNSYFPLNKQLKAKVMALSASAEMQPIVEKLKKGIATHQEWFQSYIKDLKPGEVMPYHANLGITEDEYKKFLTQVKQQVMKQVGTLDVLFQQEKDGTIKIETEQKSPINGLVIGPKSVHTPYGETTTFSEINNSNKHAPTGPWKGVQWSLSTFDEKLMEKQNFTEMKGSEVKLAVGKLANTGEGILYYDVKDFDMPKDKKVQISYVIFYPLGN